MQIDGDDCSLPGSPGAFSGIREEQNDRAFAGGARGYFFAEAQWLRDEGSQSRKYLLEARKFLSRDCRGVYGCTVGELDQARPVGEKERKTLIDGETYVGNDVQVVFGSRRLTEDVCRTGHGLKFGVRSEEIDFGNGEGGHLVGVEDEDSDRYPDEDNDGNDDSDQRAASK
jgi:hypothetical protein